LNNGEDRVMWVFGCNTKECSQIASTWKAFSYSRKTPSTAKASEATSPTAAKLEFSMDDDDPISLNELNDLLSDVAIDYHTKRKEKENSGKTERAEFTFARLKDSRLVFPCMSIEFYEDLPIKEKKKDVSSSYSLDGSTEEWNDEGYEKAHSLQVPKLLAKFQKTTANYPKQCVRYSFDGSSPLPYTSEITRDISCSRCKQKLTFEAQLMPAILSLLPVEDDKYHEGKPSSHGVLSRGMDWGSVYLFHCKNCEAKALTENEYNPIFITLQFE